MKRNATVLFLAVFVLLAWPLAASSKEISLNQVKDYTTGGLRSIPEQLQTSTASEFQAERTVPEAVHLKTVDELKAAKKKIGTLNGIIQKKDAYWSAYAKGASSYVAETGKQIGALKSEHNKDLDAIRTVAQERNEAQEEVQSLKGRLANLQQEFNDLLDKELGIKESNSILRGLAWFLGFTTFASLIIIISFMIRFGIGGIRKGSEKKSTQEAPPADNPAGADHLALAPAR